MNKFIDQISDDHIILDVVQTWPKDIVKFLKKNKQIIIKYLHQEDIIYDYLISNHNSSYKSKINIYSEHWQNFTYEIDNYIKNYNFIGFHCTRLTEEEVCKVIHEGLLPLDPLFTTARIKFLKKKGLLSSKTAKVILQSNSSNSQTRKGHICFFHCLSGLKDECGIHRLFRAWGGEAIYAQYENNASVFNELTRIGKPCIVIGSITYDEINKFSSIAAIAEKIMKISVGEEHQDIDTIINHRVQVLKLIDYSNPLFKKLTDYDKWRRKINF